MARWTLLLIALIMAGGAMAEDNVIRVAVYADEGAMEPYITRAADVASSAGMDVSRLTAQEIAKGALEQVDVIVFPGGTGSGQAKSLGEEGSNAVRHFAEDGGGVIGICAGGYLCAMGYSEDTRRLELISARLWDLDHWERGEGFVEIVRADEPTTKPMHIRFENAPVFEPAENAAELPPYVTLARFSSDLSDEPEERESIAGYDAVIAAPFGKGRVVLFATHPELTPGLEYMLQGALRWAAGDGDGEPTYETVIGGK